MEGSGKVSQFWRWFGFCPTAEFSGWPVWLLSTLLPLATACRNLGTFEKFPESLSAKSARFQPITALLGF